MHRRRLIAGASALSCLVLIVGCTRSTDPAEEAAPPSVGALWPATDPHAAARTALGETYRLFAPIDVSGTTDQEIPLPSWMTAAVVSVRYDGPVAGRGFIVTTLEKDNMPAGDTLAASLESFYRGVAALGVDTEYSGDPAKILVQDWGGGQWSLTISPVALAPTFEVPGSEGDTWSSVFLYDGPAARWLFTKQAGVGPGAFRVAEFTADKERHVLIDELMQPVYSATVTAEPGPALVIVDSDGPWRVTR